MKEKEETKKEETKKEETKEKNTKEKDTMEEDTNEKEEDTGDGREKGECYGGYFFSFIQIHSPFPPFRNERRRRRT